MTYRVIYGDVLALAGPDREIGERIQSERYSTEHEALMRARELLDEDLTTVVAVCDSAGNRLSGVRLQLKLGYACD